MQTLYGNTESGQDPDIITYYHDTDSSGSVGYWNSKGHLYAVSKFDNSNVDFRLDFDNSKHIMLVGNPSGQLLDQDDFDEDKIDEYFSYFNSNEGSLLKSELSDAQQIVVFRQQQTPSINQGKKCPKHLLQAIGLSQSSTQSAVTMIQCHSYYQIAHISDGKILHAMTLETNLKAEEVHYKVLAFYQAYNIKPTVSLNINGVDSSVVKLLSLHLPSVFPLTVPKTHTSLDAVDHQGDLYLHYLAFVCVL